MSRWRLAGAIALLAVGGLAAGHPAEGAQSLAPAWTVPALAGSVHPGPGGGAVVIAVDGRSTDGIRHVVTAYGRDGRRLWSHGRVPGCGNCDDGPQPERRQPDGTYGPVGMEGDDAWAVDARGRELPGCAGAVAPEGTCYALETRYTDLTPALTARARGLELWRVADVGYRWFPDLDIPPMVVRDGAGLLYAAQRFPTEVATGARLPGRLIAVDPAARAILWGRAGPADVLAALPSGVLALEAGGLVALGAAGDARWRRPLAAGYVTSPAQVALDARRGRLYVGRLGLDRRPSGVTALDARTGAQLWRTRPRDRARLLSVGPGGRVYLALDGTRPAQLRALGPGGRALWRYRTSAPVSGARELTGGRVAVSIAPRRFTAPGRLTLLR